MNLFGIGIDVVEVERIHTLLTKQGERFLERVFTEEEVAYCQRQKRPEIHLAARFAAKEAVSKAFGTGIGGDVGWREVEIKRRHSGEPEIILSGTAQKFAVEKGIDTVLISLTHTESYAAANAVVMCTA